jgi:hypothetical protein
MSIFNPTANKTTNNALSTEVANLGYFEAYNSAGQAVYVNTNTTIWFPTIVTNTFNSSVLTTSGAYNSVITNVSSKTIYLMVTSSAGVQSVVAGAVTGLAVWIQKASNTRFYNQTASAYTSGSNNLCASATAGVISLAPNDSFTLNLYVSGAESNYNSGYNSTNTLNMITIRQLL